MLNRSSIGAAACGALTAALAPSAAPGATIYTESSLAGPGEAARFVAIDDGELHRPSTALAMAPLGSLPGATTQQDFDVSPPTGVMNAYALIGVTPAGGIFISFGDPVSGLGRSFESLFPGFQESAVAEALLTNSPLVDAFADAVAKLPGASTPFGEASAVLHFSDGAPYGSYIASLSPIPSPGALVLLAGSGACGLARRRRRA